MRRLAPIFLLVSVAAGLFPALGSVFAQDKNWSTIKGRIVWGGEKLPKVEWLELKKQEWVAGNLKAKGTSIPDEKLLVNAKNKGIENVFVNILVDADGKLPIHPTLKDFPKEVVLDLTCCMFSPRALALREGQTFVVRNSAPVLHTISRSGDPKSNAASAVAIAPGAKTEITNLKMQTLPLRLKCDIHPWMSARLLVVNHPYCAITDADGNFEIRLAPVGKFKMMVFHEHLGYRTGAKGEFGEDVVIVPGETKLGELKMGSEAQ